MIKHLLLSLILLTIFTSPLVYGKYPSFTNTYSVVIVFKNYYVKFHGSRIVLNGSIEGFLDAKYVFHRDRVYVTVSYKRYVLNGFENPVSRRYVTSLLEGSRGYKYSVDEKPFPLNKAFIVEGRIKYYVSPKYLDPSNTIVQKPLYPLDNNSFIEEYRLFRYDKSSGVLLEIMINSTMKTNKTTTYYMLHFILSGSTNTILEKYLVNPIILMTASILIYPSILVIKYYRGKRS